MYCVFLPPRRRLARTGNHCTSITPYSDVHFDAASVLLRLHRAVALLFRIALRILLERRTPTHLTRCITLGVGGPSPVRHLSLPPPPLLRVQLRGLRCRVPGLLVRHVLRLVEFR